MESSQLSQHLIATIAYRLNRVMNGQDSDFGNFRIAAEARTPAEIMHHLYDLARKSRRFVQHGTLNLQFGPLEFLDLKLEYERFMNELRLINQEISHYPLEINFLKSLVQGPFADMLTHVGQLALLSGINGKKIQPENYSIAAIDSLIS